MSHFKIMTKRALLLTAVGVLLSACGGHAYYEGLQSGTPTSALPAPGTGYPGPVGSPIPSTPIDQGLPAYASTFTVTGAGGTHPTFTTGTINTDNILRVKVAAGAAGQLAIPQYSNFSAGYACVNFRVTAMGETRETGALAVPGNGNGAGGWLCPGAPNEISLDFSTRLAPGHGPVNVQVEAAGYDFYCSQCYQNPGLYNAYQYGCQMYCPMHTVYRTHTVSGNLKIQINGTNPN